jgi:hypothetical protein
VELGGESPDELQREAGLADAADPRERDEPDVLPADQVGESGELPFAAE